MCFAPQHPQVWCHFKCGWAGGQNTPSIQLTEVWFPLCAFFFWLV